ncbi:excinuclease ABC subunit UvrC [Natronogracilivirga saccharolytica]|uniref:UvrABC system protein C n=1 Tax=Natronogracilivirga saccharolytica TaxID=2812953 RepID=A0A8J7UVF9_9BACT|nr:excinuclease ABC subunit UvrC [Natronogracilivirga saccharolytica]MBP3192512.1 excinuclease ABC subunit C [Natronogracilivirga saccharolytica]
MNKNLLQKLDNLTSEPGVYQFKDDSGEVIYVGKAKRLNQRVRSYFQKSADHTGKIQALVRKISDLDVIITDSEAEALILENNLIKKHRPRYNILYRDDKTYPYICISNEERPRVFPTRTIIRDGSRYYGPYDHVGKMRLMLETIRKAFRLCTCACSSRMIDHSRGMPKWGKCFEDYFENCSYETEPEEYKQKINQVVRLLNGHTRELIRDLKHDMDALSENLEFEKAAVLRDGILSLEKYSSKMKMVSADGLDRDVFAIESDWDENVACGVLFQVREGKLIGKYHRFLKNIEGRDRKTLLQSFMEDYYTSALSGTVPDEVCMGNELQNDEPLFEYLWQSKNRKVPLTVPQRGEKAQMVQMARANASLLLKEWVLEKIKADQGRVPHSVKALERDLQLQRLPRRIECFDISNFQGAYTVGSMVCFVDGQPRKSEYKRFHIKDVDGPDDFASMRQVVRRRYERLKQTGGQLPDLVVVDGGKGQLSGSVETLKEIGMHNDLAVIGLAKRLEEIFFPGETYPVMIPKSSSSLKLLQRIRDEAHRFAITFHRDVRSKQTFRSELQEIPGIGVKSSEKLIKHFGSAAEVAKQDFETLKQVVGKKSATAVFSYFSPEQKEEK